MNLPTLPRANMTAWAKAGVKTVVTSCADGYHAFKRLYPELGCSGRGAAYRGVYLIA